jgi:endonuclease/exonuclease/phosphatase (EEP) superfamily protein YafD
MALLLPTLWFVHDYGALFVPEVTPVAKAEAETRPLRVMTLNTWKQYSTTEEFVAAVRAWQPDVIALQEVDNEFYWELHALEHEWPYRMSTRIRSATRVALLSKVPIGSYVADNSVRGCHCLEAILDWDGEPVRVILVHLLAPRLGQINRAGLPLRVQGFDTSRQARNLTALLNVISARDVPTIVLGDFNTTERQEGYRRLLAAGLTNAHAEVGWGFGLTYPAPRSRFSWLPMPVIRIDHLFYDERWRAERTWTTPLMGSDHQALLADLVWVGE